MWVETSAEVYAVIFARHRNALKPHSTFSDPDGYGYEWSSGRPEMLTEWGFDGAKTPLIKIVQTKEHRDCKEWDNKFYIYYNDTE